MSAEYLVSVLRKRTHSEAGCSDEEEELLVDPVSNDKEPSIVERLRSIRVRRQMLLSANLIDIADPCVTLNPPNGIEVSPTQTKPNQSSPIQSNQILLLTSLYFLIWFSALLCPALPCPPHPIQSNPIPCPLLLFSHVTSSRTSKIPWQNLHDTLMSYQKLRKPGL